MVNLKDEFQISKHFNLCEYDSYMKQKPLDQRIMLDFIIDLSKSNKNIKIIEFGAGTGRFTKFLLEILPKANITLVEPDKLCCVRLEKLKRKYHQIKIIQSSVETFTSAKLYDVVVMAAAFHHIRFEAKSIALKNINALLGEKGIFLCGDIFLAKYSTLAERKRVLRKSIDKWVKEAKNDKKELKMALATKKI